MLLFCDSFDLYSTLSQKWDNVNSTPSISKSAARSGTNGLLITTGGGVHIGVQKNFSARATYFAGFAFFVLGASGQDAVVGFYDGGTNQCELRINATGNFQFYRDGTAIGSQSTFALKFGCWHYLEVMVTINSSSGVCQLKVDGSFVLQLSGQNTQATGNASASGVTFGPWDFASSGSTYYFDDLVIYDNTGSYNNYFIGDVKVSAQVPSANGSTNNYAQNGASWASGTVALGQQCIDSNGNLQRVSQAGTTGGSHPTWATTPIGATTTDGGAKWTLIQIAPLSNFNFVNEIPPDPGGTYLSDATVNDEDLYEFPALSGSSVNAVVVNLRACKDDASTRSVRALAKSGSTTADNGSDFALSENVYADYEGVFEVDPNTGVPWTIAGVNAAQFGIKTTA